MRSFFWSVFSRIWTKYREILCISPYSVQMLENKDQKKLHIWTLFSHWGSNINERECFLVLFLSFFFVTSSVVCVYFFGRTYVISLTSLGQVYSVDTFSCLSNDINHDVNKARDTDVACRFYLRYCLILSSMTSKRQWITRFFSIGY